MFLIYISLIPLIIDNTGKKDAKSRCSRLKKAFGDPLAPIDLSFFSSTLNVFSPYNKFYKDLILFQIKFTLLQKIWLED